MSNLPLRTQHIFDGNVGIYQTLVVMRKVIISACDNREFNIFAKQLVQIDWSIDQKINWLENYVYSNVKYVSDPNAFEYVKYPILLFKEIIGRGYAEGDCDDHVVLLSALLTCNFIPNSIIALAIPSQGEGFNHVVNGIPNGNGNFSLFDTSVKIRPFSYPIAQTMKLDILS